MRSWRAAQGLSARHRQYARLFPVTRFRHQEAAIGQLACIGDIRFTGIPVGGHQARQSGNHLLHQLLHPDSRAHLAVENPVEHVLGGPTQLTKNVSANRTPIPLKSVEMSSYIPQYLVGLRVERPGFSQQRQLGNNFL